MKIAVIGAGSFGTAISNIVAENCEEVFLFERNALVINSINNSSINSLFFPDIKLNSRIHAYAFKEKEVLKQADIAIFAVPSRVMKEVAEKVRPQLKDKIILSGAKGIAFPSLHTMSTILRQTIGTHSVYSLSGPTFADELVKKHISGITLGINNNAHRKVLSSLFHGTTVVPDFSQDVVGVELCGVLKNIYAIAMGIFDTYFSSFNEHYTFLNLCYKEMEIILKHFSRDGELLSKFCAFGDFNLTANVDKSRNRTLGLVIGKRIISLEGTNSSIVFEGIKAAKALEMKCNEAELNIPIISFVNSALTYKTNLKSMIYETIIKPRNGGMTF